jgi:hypothetical protein
LVEIADSIAARSAAEFLRFQWRALHHSPAMADAEPRGRRDGSGA